MGQPAAWPPPTAAGGCPCWHGLQVSAHLVSAHRSCRVYYVHSVGAAQPRRCEASCRRWRAPPRCRGACSRWSRSPRSSPPRPRPRHAAAQALSQVQQTWMRRTATVLLAPLLVWVGMKARRAACLPSRRCCLQRCAAAWLLPAPAEQQPGLQRAALGTSRCSPIVCTSAVHRVQCNSV